MARKATSLVASALLLLAVAFLSHDAGVEAWCVVKYPAVDRNTCRGRSRDYTPCPAVCLAIGPGFTGKCNTNDDCVCIKCADEPSAAPAYGL